MPAGPTAPPSGGIIDTARSFLATWIAILKTRVELISLELEEQRAWIEQLVLLGLAALFCISLGILLLTLFVVVLFWPSHPVLVLGIFAFLYLAAGVVLWFVLSARLKTRPRIFSATASELARDYAAMQPRTP